MKTYVIHNANEIVLAMSTDSKEQLEANKKLGSYCTEIDGAFNPMYYKAENGKIVKKSAEEIQGEFR